MNNMVKITIAMLLLSELLFSSIDYVDVYRQNGIKEVEKLLNKQLLNKEYWQESLKNKNLNNGYYESLKYLLVCTKDMQNISVYDTKNNNIIYESKVITGEKNGAKISEGDLKTPIGAYKLLKKLDNLDTFFGPFALTTNYPNKFDISRGKTGSGIWIHGVPFSKKRDPFTKGCIALENDKLMNLEANINLKESMLIISENKKQLSNIKDISTILSQIFTWRDAWKYSNFKKYISFYSKEFKRADGSLYKAFKKYKKRIFAKNQKKSILFTNINIIPYPNELNKNLYKISMHENYKTSSYKFIGEKVLYVELINNKMKILFE